MRFNKLDLNLLVALDVLLKERSITKAAEQLNLSPSAVSNALNRLREYFDDELLVQIGRRMEPTPRAQGLQEPVRDVLVRIDSTIAAQPEFDPTASDRVFRLFASDYSQFVWAPSLLKRAAIAGFRGRFEFLPQVNDPARDLERGEADLVVIPSLMKSDLHPYDVIYEEGFMCLVSRDSALAEGELTLERYVNAGHVVMHPHAIVSDSFENSFLTRYGVSRTVAVRTYGFSMLPALVSGTEYIATVHARLAERLLQSFPLVSRPCPIQIEPMRQCMQWHKYRQQDAGIQWLRTIAAEATLHMDRAYQPALQRP